MTDYNTENRLVLNDTLKLDTDSASLTYGSRLFHRNFRQRLLSLMFIRLSVYSKVELVM